MKSLLPTFNRRPVGNPAGGINSTLSDMIKYIRFHLNNGQVEGRALISKQSANEMHKPQIPVEYFAGNPLRGINDYGLGWHIETYRNQILVHHGGWIEGYVSWVLNSSNRPKLISRMKMGIGPALQKNIRLWHSTC